ncbi:MAG: serine/threonine-protein kinase, partial [Pirellulaceae bacterium]
LGIEITNALEYAHQQGVVHRDIKPSNLLLDMSGKPWITDFGLAQTHNEGNPTATGDMLGTLRYMSPEQAEGKKLLDHRTDIYSLAASLYELMTLESVVTGETRQEMLRQLEAGHVRSPRSVDPGISRDLEKVLLKALAFRAEDRYGSAAEFACDLQRFVDNRPVQARPVGSLQQTFRWVDRHRFVATLIGLIALLLLSISIVAPIVALRYQAERNSAKQSNDELIDMLFDSVNVTSQLFENVPDNPLLNREYITNTFQRIDRLLVEDPTNPKLRFAAGVAYRDLAWAANFRYDDDLRSVEWYRHSHEILSDLVAEYPNNLRYKDALCGVLRLRIAVVKGQDSKTIATYLAFRKELTVAAPDNLEYLSNYGLALGTVANLAKDKGNLKEAEAFYEQCDAVLELCAKRSHDVDESRYIRAWFKTHHAILIREEYPDLAIANFKHALELYGDDLSNSSIVTRWKIGRAMLLRQLATALRDAKELSEAEQHIRRATAETKSLMHGFPNSEWLQMEYFLSHASLLRLLWHRGEVDEAMV